jgi:hypothetical protein
MIRYVVLLALALLAFSNTARAQSCNPASVYYIVRDEKGQVLSEEQLTALSEKLPKEIGDARVSIGKVSFSPDKVTYYWPESVDFEKGAKVPALRFSNSGECMMHLGEVTLPYQSRNMRLVFNIDINRTQDDRRQVIDSLRFQNGDFQLDLNNWNRADDKMIPATHWKKNK